MTEEPSDRELMRSRFTRLIQELLQKRLSRNSFQPWEIELLLDIEACGLENSDRARILRQYARTVEQQIERSSGPPLKLSQFLQGCHAGPGKENPERRSG